MVEVLYGYRMGHTGVNVSRVKPLRLSVPEPGDSGVAVLVESPEL